MTTPTPWLLVLDSATSRVVVAAGTPAGALIAERSFAAEHRHGELLLATIDELARAEALDIDGMGGIVVGTGPGAFTGLRVGLATAKTLAHELGVPIAGVSTAEALLEAAGDATLVSLPAGPNDRIDVSRGGAPRLVVRGAPDVDQTAPASDGQIAVDLDGRATSDAIALGRHALDGLAAALLRLGVARLDGGGDDPERLVPEYVTLPRGVAEGLDLEQGVAWSHDRR